MDLRKYPATQHLDQDELLSLWWYQPYIFADDIVSGVTAQNLVKGIHNSIIKRSDDPKKFKRFWDFSERTGTMYQGWCQALCELSGIKPREASVFEIACNTGYLLRWFNMRGGQTCVGIDKSDELARQRSILNDVTDVHNIDFREGRWSSETHSIQGLDDNEKFDFVICSAFAQHISDPLHLIRELSKRTNRAMLLHTLIGNISLGMNIKYVPAAHHEKWGDTFPNNLDTKVTRKLLMWSLKECGFKEIIQLKNSRTWLPWWWYRVHSTLICLK